MDDRTLFIKPSRPIDVDVKLDPVLVSNNKLNGLETTITLDTNILISMEKVVKEGNKWSSVKKHGLHNLVKLLQRCPPRSVVIAPGHALNEMPPARAAQSIEKYELFCQEHLPNFVDAHNAIYHEYKGKDKDYGFADLSDEAKASLAISYSYILYLNLVDRTVKGKPIDKFLAFLNIIESKVDILSATEIEIAKYCFVEPPADCVEIIHRRGKIRENFLKTRDDKLPRNINELLAIAFNGSCDIHLLHAANIADQHGVDGIGQDTWIATKDKKLVEFCGVFHHVNVDGQVGKYAASTIGPEHNRDVFWSLAEKELMSMSVKRKKYNESRCMDFLGGIAIADEAVSVLMASFGSEL